MVWSRKTDCYASFLLSVSFGFGLGYCTLQKMHRENARLRYFALFLRFLPSIAFFWISQNHVFPFPVLQKIIKIIGKTCLYNPESLIWVLSSLYVAVRNRIRSVEESDLWLTGRSGQRSNDDRIQYGVIQSDKNTKSSRLSTSINTFSSLIFHKPLTYDRNHINPDRILLLKSCYIRCRARTAVG